MLGCCTRAKGVSHITERQTLELEARVIGCLDRIVQAYPGLATVAIMTTNGDVLAQREGKPTNKEEEPVPLSDDVLAAIASLKKVALQMATTLREADCPMISITGDTHVFSCQELGPYLLAVFLDVRGLDADTLDLAAADARAAEATQELRAIMKEHDRPPS